MHGHRLCNGYIAPPMNHIFFLTSDSDIDCSSNSFFSRPTPLPSLYFLLPCCPPSQSSSHHLLTHQNLQSSIPSTHDPSTTTAHPYHDASQGPSPSRGSVLRRRRHFPTTSYTNPNPSTNRHSRTGATPPNAQETHPLRQHRAVCRASHTRRPQRRRAQADAQIQAARRGPTQQGRARGDREARGGAPPRATRRGGSHPARAGRPPRTRRGTRAG